MNNKPDQPFYKRWWLFIALVIVFSIGAMTEGLIKAKTETIKKSQNPTNESQDLEKPEKPEKPEEIEEIEEIVEDDEAEEEVEREEEPDTPKEPKELEEELEDEEVEKTEEPQVNLDTSVKDKVNKVIGDKPVTINIRDQEVSIKVKLEETSMSKTDILTETKNILKELSEEKDLSQVAVNYNLEEDIILDIVMTRETLDSINWDSFNIEDFEGLKLKEERITN